jgi:hypothetical protein
MFEKTNKRSRFIQLPKINDPKSPTIIVLLLLVTQSPNSRSYEGVGHAGKGNHLRPSLLPYTSEWNPMEINGVVEAQKTSPRPSLLVYEGFHGMPITKPLHNQQIIKSTI